MNLSTFPTPPFYCRTSWDTITFTDKLCRAMTLWGIPIVPNCSLLKKIIFSSQKTPFTMYSKPMSWLRIFLRIPHVRISVCCWSVCIRARKKTKGKMASLAASLFKYLSKIGSLKKINRSWGIYNAVQWLSTNITIPRKALYTFNSTIKTWTAQRFLSKRATKPVHHPPVMTKCPTKTL